MIRILPGSGNIVMQWAADEMATADLNDMRLDKRLTQILSDFSERPNMSIAAASGGHAEITAAYRLATANVLFTKQISERSR